MREEFRSIKEFPSYLVSNTGIVKSIKYNKERVLKPSTLNSGYLNVILSEDGVKTSIKVHQLVAIAFLNHKRSGYKNVVNHINFNTLDNNINNLEIVSARENCNKKHIKSSSKYVGVTYKKRDRRWMAQIKIDGVNKYLGYFKNELDASNAYQSALKYYICK